MYLCNTHACLPRSRHTLRFPSRGGGISYPLVLPCKYCSVPSSRCSPSACVPHSRPSSGVIWAPLTGRRGLWLHLFVWLRGIVFSISRSVLLAQCYFPLMNIALEGGVMFPRFFRFHQVIPLLLGCRRHRSHFSFMSQRRVNRACGKQVTSWFTIFVMGLLVRSIPVGKAVSYLFNAKSSIYICQL